MFDTDFWREVFQSIDKNRTRSLLSGFTVAFAILLFAVLFGLANGLNNTFSEAFVDDAANSIFIRSGRTTKAHKGVQFHLNAMLIMFFATVDTSSIWFANAKLVFGSID